MVLEINSNEVQSITRNNKKVVLIVRSSDSSTIYEVDTALSISLTTNKQTLCYVDSESATLTATVLDASNNPVSGKTVNLYNSSNTLIGAMNDNNDGTYSYTYTPSASGAVTFYAEVEAERSGTATVTATKRVTTISMIISSNNIVYGNSVTLNGSLQHSGTGVDNVSVKLYNGETLVDTLTTSNGVFSKTITGLNVGSYTFKAVFEGDTDYENITSSNVSVTVTQHGSTLNINVPTTLVYSDAFNITGTLTDGTNPITNATVKLLVGSTEVSSQTTDNNGQVSFTQTPVSMGNHSFQLSYAGDTNHSGATSSVVTRDITKETSVLTVTTPSNTTTSMYADGTLSVAGTLQSDDGEAISGATINIKESSTTLGTATTDSNGAFTTSVSSLTAGTHTLTIEFAATSTHTTSSVTKTVVVSDPSISLAVSTYDKNGSQISSASSSAVLSYVDEEYAVLTATYTGANVSGKTISFDVVENGVVVENIGSDTTDNNGVASVTYLSKGAGDLYIRAQCGMILSGSFVISDVIKYDPSSQSNLSNYTTNNLTFSYDSTKEAYYLKQNNTTNTWGTATLNNITVSDNVKVSIDFYMEHRQNEQVGLQIGNVMFRALNYQRSIDIISVSQTGITSMVSNVVSVATWLTMEVVIANGTGTMTIKQGDTTLGTVSCSVSSYISSSNAFRLAQGVNNSDFSYIKNIKIKPL